MPTVDPCVRGVGTAYTSRSISPVLNPKSSDHCSFFRSLQLTNVFYHGAYQANRDLFNDKAIHRPHRMPRMIELVLV